MFNIDRWQEIFEAISKNKLRTFLTGISVGSGIFILVILLGIANGLKKGIKQKMEVDATNKVQFWGAKTSLAYKGLKKNRPVQFELKDYEYITQNYKEAIEYESPNFKKNWRDVFFKNEGGNYRVIGVYPQYQFISNVSLLSGRFLSEKDIQNHAKVAVIGLQLVEDLKINLKKDLGDYVEINQVKYKIIGMYKDPGSKWQNNIVYVPHSTLTQVYNSVKNAGTFSFTLPKTDDYDRDVIESELFVKNISSFLKKKYWVHPKDDRAVRFHNRITSSKNIYDLNNGIQIFFWGIGLLTLVAGVVGIGNIMLIIVKERTKEIGIRKALGAQPKDIVIMVLHESIFITAISGMIGMFLGLICLEIAGKIIQTDFIVNPSIEFNVALITVALLVIAGAIAGYVPAKYAAKVKPIIALKDE